MNLTEPQLVALKAMAERFMDSDLGLALSNGCLDLIADLEEACVTPDGQKIELYEQQKYILELESEIAATRKQLEDANDSIYKLNQDYKMATQLAASYLNELQEVRQQLAEAQAVLLDAARHGAAYALLRAGADGVEISDEELTALLPTPD